MESDFLVVKPKPVVEPIIFVEASSTHPLPALYSAEDGSPWYVNIMSPEAYQEIKNIPDDAKEMAADLKMVKDFFTGEGGSGFKPDEVNEWTKRSYDVAIRKMNKGELIFSDGTKGVTNRYHRYTVANIDGNYSQQVMMGVNRGKFKPGVSSKSINQLEAQSGKGAGKIFKTLGEIAPVWDALCDMADILVSAANGKLPSLPFTPPFVSWEVERFWADVDEFILRQWNSSLQQAISKGREDLNLFLKDAGEINKTYNLRYSLINLSEEFLSKILTKEWCEYDKSSNDFESYITNQSQGKKVASILVQKLEQNDQYNRLTYYHYIHAIYLKDMKL